VTPFSARMDLATRSDAYAGAMHASSVPSCIFNVSFPVWRLRSSVKKVLALNARTVAPRKNARQTSQRCALRVPGLSLKLILKAHTCSNLVDTSKLNYVKTII